MKQSCETCANYIFDEESDCYCCDAALDQDELGRFMTDRVYNCPFYSFYDEYGIVRKQN